MSIFNRKESLALALGDVGLFLLALWLMLVLRYGGLFDKQIFYAHLAPFSMLFVVWLGVFFIAGLYEKHTLLMRNRLPGVLLKAVTANTFIAIIFFYFIPYFGIAPKVNLFICLFFSFTFILLWRMYGYRFLDIKRKQDAIIIGTGPEFVELFQEVNQNPRYGIRFIAEVAIDNPAEVDFERSILKRIQNERVALVVLDIRNKKIEPLLPQLYKLIFKDVRFVDIHELYEEIFDRIPLSSLKDEWFMENVSALPRAGYDALKRAMDVSLAFCLGLLSLAFYPFIIAAIKLDDGGPVFIFQERVGRRDFLIRTIKFRTMAHDDAGLADSRGKNHPTRVGPFLRRTRLDELPQFWNVLAGDLSLIGPRPELPSLAAVYKREVPHYDVRHLITPGLSGWAQLYHDKHPHHSADVSQTRVKLSYDLYYIKNRSFFLDLKIALKTIKALLSRTGV